MLVSVPVSVSVSFAAVPSTISMFSPRKDPLVVSRAPRGLKAATSRTHSKVLLPTLSVARQPLHLTDARH